MGLPCRHGTSYTQIFPGIAKSFAFYAGCADRFPRDEFAVDFQVGAVTHGAAAEHVQVWTGGKSLQSCAGRRGRTRKVAWEFHQREMLL